MATPNFAAFLTHEARNDLAAIGEYIAHHHSDEEALATVEKIEVRVASLAEFPLRGSVPRELEEMGNRDHRQLLVAPYRLVYRVLDNAVFVLLIADGRRDLRALLRYRLLASR
jgi:toxin ParE1/3/4